MSQFRSEEMNLVQLFVQSDAAHETLHELGQIGAIQFKDVRAPSPRLTHVPKVLVMHTRTAPLFEVKNPRHDMDEFGGSSTRRRRRSSASL